jgi:hypothetical protein
MRKHPEPNADVGEVLRRGFEARDGAIVVAQYRLIYPVEHLKRLDILMCKPDSFGIFACAAKRFYFFAGVLNCPLQLCK